MKYVLMSGSFTRMEIYQEIIDFLNKFSLNKKNIAFITADFNDYSSNDKYIKKLIKLFNDKEFIFNSVYTIDNRIDSYEMKNYIKDSDIVFLLGGDTLKQIKFINKYKLKNIIKEKNKVVIGMSAGSINMAKKVVLARDIDDGIPNLSIYKGIGITDINIEPHCDFRNEEHWKDRNADRQRNLDTGETGYRVAGRCAMARRYVRRDRMDERRARHGYLCARRDGDRLAVREYYD